MSKNWPAELYIHRAQETWHFSSVLSKSDTIYSNWVLISTIPLRRSYPTPIRYVSSEVNLRKMLIECSGTCYGLSAAFGKTGAAIGVQVFTPIQKHLGPK